MDASDFNAPPLQVAQLLRQYGLRPKKSLGQNFLVDERALKKIAAAANINPTDLVLEIGPGLGSLTRHLAWQSQQVIAVEIDEKMMGPLHEVLQPFENVTIIRGDILTQDIPTLLTRGAAPNPAKTYKVIANIPYYITSALIRFLLEAEIKPTQMTLLVQKEVAMRICAEPPDLSLLALSVQVYGEPRIVAKIPAGAFYPPPQVDSAVIQIDLYPLPIIPPPLTDLFFRLAKAGFSQKRKNLRNSLSAGLNISKAEVEDLLQTCAIDPKRRAETLSLDEWQTLTHQYQQKSAAQP